MQSSNLKVNLEQCFWLPTKQFHKTVIITFSQRETYLRLLDNQNHLERFQIFVTREFKDDAPHKLCKERRNLQPFNTKGTSNVTSVIPILSKHPLQGSLTNIPASHDFEPRPQFSTNWLTQQAKLVQPESEKNSIKKKKKPRGQIPFVKPQVL